MAVQSKYDFDLKYFALTSPIILSGAAFLILASFIAFLLQRPKKLDLPIVGEPGSADYRQAMVEGTARYPDSPFIIPLSPPLVMLPISVINEVRNLPENKASFDLDIRRQFQAKHTGIGTQDEVIKAVKIDLTRHIASTLDDLQDEIRYGLDKEFGSCEDWTKFSVYSKVTRLVALLSGRVFVGRPLSREEEWINATIMFTFYAVQTKRAVESWPEWSRNIVAPFLPEIKHLKSFKRRGGDLLWPILEAQMKKEGNEKLHLEGMEDEQGTVISWLLKYTDPNNRYDVDKMVENQMGLSMAAIHTTSMATTAAIYDLAAYPENIQPLRDELEKVISEDGHDIDGDGFMRLKKSSIPKLWKLDSFLKESQRFTPPGLPSHVRITTSPITLSTGHTLPKNTRFGLPAYALHNFPPPSVATPYQTSQTKPLSQFDGMRYHDLRKTRGNENKHQFVTTSSESLNFGHGNHACPGRFFASNEIKVVLIELLREWDFRFVGDTEGKGGKEMRPENAWNLTACTPNPRGEMEFRRRKIGV